MELYCHIGMQKCGSKALQHFCTTNAKALEARGFTYPDNLSRGVWHRDAFNNYSPELGQKLAAQQGKVILSFEGAFMSKAEDIAQVTKDAQAVHLLIYVRRPGDWINSFLNQIIKSHRTRRGQFDDFDVRDKKVRSKFEINNHIRRWKKNAPVKSISVVPYEKGRDIFEDFFDWLNVAPEERTGFQALESNPNKSLDVASARMHLELKRQLQNEDVKTQVRAIKRLHERLEKQWVDTAASAGAWYLSAEDVAWANKTYIPLLDKALTKYGSGPLGNVGAEADKTRTYITELEPTPEDLAIVKEVLASR